MSTAPPETVPIRRLFKNMAQSSAAYSIPFVLQRLAGIFMIPVTTRYLSPTDYGTVDLLDQALSVIALLLGVRFASTLGFFHAAATSAEGRRIVASTTILGAALVGTAAAALCWPFCGQLSVLVFGNSEAERYFKIALMTWPVGFCMEALFSLMRVQDRPGMFAVASGIRLVLGIVTILLFVVGFKMRVAGMLYSALVSGLLTGAILFVDLLRRMRPGFDWALFTRMVKYALPLGLGAVATFIINVGDRFLLPHYRPLEELGIYVLAYKIGMMLSFVYGSFESYWGTQVFEIMRREDADRVFARVFTYVVLGLTSIGLGLIVFAKPVLTVASGPEFLGAADVVPLIVLAYFIRVIGDFLRSRFLVSGRPGADAVTNWFGSLICLVCYWLLIPRYGIWGAATATVVAFAIISIISAVWTYYIRPYRLETGRLAKVTTALVVAVSIGLLMPADTLLSQITIGVSAMAIFGGILWLLRFVTPGELRDAKGALELMKDRIKPRAFRNAR